MSFLISRARLETSLDVNEVRHRLSERLVGRAGLVESVFRGADFLSDFTAEKPEKIRFAGTVSVDGFKLIRWVPYRNSFRPEIVGTFTPRDPGTVVDIQIRKPAVALAAVAAWVLVAGLGIWAWRSGLRLSFSIETAFPIALGLVLTLVFVLAPKIEARKARAGLASVIEATTGADGANTAPFYDASAVKPSDRS
jgi:hypothetical protein